jgi:nucleoid DNA-binding protein
MRERTVRTVRWVPGETTAEPGYRGFRPLRVLEGKPSPPSSPKENSTMTKTELERAVADAAGVEKRTAAAVLDALQNVVTTNVRKGDAVTIRPGFIKVTRKDVKARKARKGTNPFTGEPTVFKARPASKTAKVTALKKLKDGIGGKSR